VHQQARIFIAVAWANKYDIRAFNLFPEGFHCDCTCNTNNTNNHLLAFSWRTSTGKQIVFLRIWIPNQKRFSFRWVFKFVLTSVFETRVLLRTRLIMVDGDPQQRGELRKAIVVFMPNAMDGGCGWHLVEQGWKAHGPGVTAVKDVGRNREKFNLFKKRVKDWCYSWMTPGGVVGRTSSLHYYYLAFIVLTYLAYPIAVNTSYRSSLGTTDPGIQAPCCIRLGYSEKVRKAHVLLLLISRISSHSIVPIRVFS
jgi:hypothetical protein